MRKIGLIGCGFMGSMHANCYAAIEDVEVVAVADVRKDKAKELAKLSNAKIYSSGKELLENEKLDAIDICLPTYLHAEHALIAMEKTPYVFIEKPVCLNENECLALLQKQKKTGAHVQVGQVIRFWNEYAHLEKIVHEKKYGKVVHAQFSRISPKPDWAWENWILDVKKSNGAAFDLQIHDADYVLNLFGEPKSFNSILNKLGEKNAFISTNFDYDDFVINVTGSWNFPKDYPFEMSFCIVFEDAVVSLNNKDGFLLFKDGKQSKIEMTKNEAVSNVQSKGNISSLGGYFNELKYFCDCIKNGKSPDKASLESGIKSARFVLSQTK